jgi:putative ABC transport system ATP-binding protein
MIKLCKLSKHYLLANAKLPVLRGIDLNIEKGEFVAIMGPSGSGKSTLLNILGILDRYDEGKYLLNGELIDNNLSATQAAHYRNRLLGFVFQSFNLLPFKTALDNITLPLQYQKIERRTRETRAMRLLERVGLSDRATHLPNELSGGQRQRVAIARALACDPPLLLADEPTGSLDSVSSKEIMALFTEINREGKTLVMVTHDESIAKEAARIIRFHDGVIVSTSEK